MGTSKAKPTYLLLIFLSIYFQFFHHLGALGLVGPDEPRYAKVAKQMIISGDYVTPRLSGQPWLEKPILYYWLTALAYKILGINELAARLVSALAGSLGVMIVYKIGYDWISPRGGFFAASILSTSVLYFTLARAASMDMLLTATLTAAWAGFYFAFFRSAADRPGPGFILSDARIRVYLSYIFLALSVLAKGPVGLALFVCSLGLFFLVTRQVQLLREMRLVIGALIFLIIALPWYWLCYQANGYVFIQKFLLEHNLERFTTDRYQHLQPFWFYLAVVVTGFLPWVFQLISPARQFFEKKLKVASTGDAKELFVWLWVLVPLLFFSFSKSKLPGYILPIAPATALIIAKEFETFLTGSQSTHNRRWFRRTAVLQAFFIALLGLALPFFASRLNLEITSFVPQLRGILIAVGALGMLLIYRNQVQALFLCYLMGTGFIVFFITQEIFPQIDPLESARKLAAIIKQEGYTNQPVFLLGQSRRLEYGLNFYLDTTTQMIYSENDFKPFKEKEVFLIAPFSFQPKAFHTDSGANPQRLFGSQKIIKVIPRSATGSSRQADVS